MAAMRSMRAAQRAVPDERSRPARPGAGGGSRRMSSRSAVSAVAGALRPFDEGDGVLGASSQPSSTSSCGARQAVEIGVHDGHARRLVDLHQGEGRARHLEGGVAGEQPDQRPGEGRLAGAEAAREGDEIAGLQFVRENARQALRGGAVVSGSVSDSCEHGALLGDRGPGR